MSRDPLNRFKLITMRAKLPDGRIIQSYNSYPMGATNKEYDRIVDATWKAFPNGENVIKGTYL